MMRQQCEHPKNKRFNNQNNNFAHAPGIFVYLFAIFVGLNYGEKIPNFVFYGERKQATTKFCFAFWTWTWSLGIHIREGWWLHLNERMQINFLSSVLVAVTLRDLKVHTTSTLHLVLGKAICAKAEYVATGSVNKGCYS